jgi:alkylation response protein AidB-like acyl-CoA dehydrogenase
VELEFTADQDELRAAVRAVLDRECPMAFVRELAEKRSGGATPVGRDGDPLWSRMVELGWPALTVPEDAGGLGFGPIELTVLAEELGRALAPGPLLVTTSQFVPAVVETADAERRRHWLRPVASEGRTGALAVRDDRDDDPAHVSTTATRDGDTWVLDGRKPYVVDATGVDLFVIAARAPGTAGDDGVAAFVVTADTAGVDVTPVHGLDPTRALGTVTLHGARIPAAACLAPPGPETARALRRAVETATVALAVEMLGVVQSIFDVTLEYAKQREQFGVPIGSFQAIKHKFADMLVMIERARATAYFAALTIAEDDERRRLATSMAKAAAGDAQALVAKEGIQVHGGIGYTWEHDMHLYVRRAKTDAALFGTAAEHRQRVADELPW